MKKSRILLAAVGLAVLFFLLPRPEQAEPFVQAHLAMSTVATVKLYLDEERARPLAAQAFAEIDRLDSLMSRHSPASELSWINREAAGAAVTCAPEMAQVLARAQEMAHRSAGAFDITIGPVSRLWNFPQAQAPPPAGQLDSALALVGYAGLQVDGQQVRFLRSGLYLDLGGVAKGSAVDRAAALLQQSGAACGLVDLGGNIRFWGSKPDGAAWRMGVQHPRDRVRVIEVEDIGLPALATSGDYEQFFEYQGQRFHHLLDPATGQPARRAVSATVWTETAIDADILSTTVFVLGPERGLALVEELPRTEALVFFERDGRLEHRTSRGLSGRVHVDRTEP